LKRSTKIVRGLVHALGFELTRLQPLAYEPHANILGVKAFKDIQRLMPTDKPAVLFDIGANFGQSVRTFKSLFPTSLIHSFEPSPTVYEQLVEKVKDYDDLHINNLAVGSACGEQTFLENSQSEMSSFLRPGQLGWGKVEKETLVKVVTLGDYCESNQIPFISLLKIDTQGYELEVLKGAQTLMREDRIQMIYLEVNFAELYVGLPRVDDIFGFLLDNNFRLVSFYEFAHQGHLASWSDALFLNKKFQRPLLRESSLENTR
jgi:FkbM family methyltransferase